MTITIVTRDNATTNDVLDGIVTTILRDRAELNPEGGYIQSLDGTIVAEYAVA